MRYYLIESLKVHFTSGHDKPEVFIILLQTLSTPALLPWMSARSQTFILSYIMKSRRKVTSMGVDFICAQLLLFRYSVRT